ncbi:conserved exported hypothetical protein [Candidatus Terasakiella magnetica]|uniref:OmpA-like domain-containing protein n=1 Tax=Candidatus Terasakiella magnetica TaxID=1867952 RepID=A0A1C3REH3_9PROT|nr:hypothetical protein [Candidatus Terasakiella magnetica]SCA55690.1 conserved exported hypothetical protein [Candidatus Terasakiella magnetica]
MVLKWSKAGIVITALTLSACSFTEEALWPSLTGEDPAENTATSEQAGASAAANQTVASAGQPVLGTTNFEPAPVTQGDVTGTFVGKKVASMRGELAQLIEQIRVHNTELQNLRGKTIQDSQRYHGTVAAINARLQVGTTPGNPILVQQFNSSLSDLDRISSDIAQMSSLTQKVAEDSAMSAYMLESVHSTFGLSGAVDEDHRQLAILQDEVNQTVVLIERLLKEVTEDVRRQTNYVAAERANLNALAAGVKAGEIYGASLSNRMSAVNTGITSSVTRPSFQRTAVPANRRPLVVIRFDRNKVNYQQALYTTVSQVLDRRPDAMFELVAVSPERVSTGQQSLGKTQARRQAEQVLQSLTEMGLPPSRVGLGASTSRTATSNEVHLYLR